MIVLNEMGTPELNVVHHCRAEALLSAFDTESVDLVVTSPPYNLQNTSGGGIGHSANSGLWKGAALADGYDTHDDNMPHEDYVAWQRRVLDQCMRVLKPTGAIFYNHKWRVQNGLLQDRADILEGFPVRQIIIWERGGSVNFNDTFFLPSYEVIYVIAKSDYRLAPKASSLKDIWRVTPETGNDHPAPFPIAIPYRCISASLLPPVAVIVDPFLGSGTTALAAKQLGHCYVGCDTALKYVRQAQGRLGHDTSLETLPMFAARPA